ncbi:MAG: OmpA family protein [Kofleriaceae bacterium]
MYPRLPVPKPGRESDPNLRRKGPRFDKLLLAILGGALIAGFVLGFVARPVLKSDNTLATRLAESDKAAASHKQRADDAVRSVEKLTEERKAMANKLAVADTAQKQLAGRAAEADKVAKDAAAVQAKLKAAVDKSGSVSTEYGEVHIQLSDKLLFKIGDDQLTERGKAVLAKLAITLKDLSDKQVSVQGHTDDTPVPQPPMPAIRRPTPKRGQKPAPLPPRPTGKFATNWELSSARALTIVHYLQDVAKLAPTRLAALAFGQYRPVSRANRALNRRIEIVVSPSRDLVGASRSSAGAAEDRRRRSRPGRAARTGPRSRVRRCHCASARPGPGSSSMISAGLRIGVESAGEIGIVPDALGSASASSSCIASRSSCGAGWRGREGIGSGAVADPARGNVGGRVRDGGGGGPLPSR